MNRLKATFVSVALHGAAAAGGLVGSLSQRGPEAPGPETRQIILSAIVRPPTPTPDFNHAKPQVPALRPEPPEPPWPERKPVTLDPTLDRPAFVEATPRPSRRPRVDPQARVNPPAEGRATDPQLVRYPEVEYPWEARRRGEAGVVIVAFDIAPDGAVLNPALVATSGSRMLDEAALTAILTARYRPVHRWGVPVTARDTFRFVFRLL